ncbi:hypothetical protein [Arcobacter sp. F2176]|nr:hypothetical protein [Arcobacter sp. F2176]
MIKKSLIILNIIIVLMASGCASFKETYKPLYQVKPETETIDGF